MKLHFIIYVTFSPWVKLGQKFLLQLHLRNVCKWKYQAHSDRGYDFVEGIYMVI